MKTKFKKNGKRLLAAVLCLVMAVMALPMSAFAWTSEEGVSCTSSFGDYYVGSDGEYYRSKSSYSFIVYDSDGNTSVRTISAGNAKRKYLMTDSDGTHQVYCVESGIDFNTGNSYVSQNGKNSSYFRKLPTEAQFGVMMALMYGWNEGKSSPVAGTNTDDYAFATQTIIWEYQQQLRTSPSDLHSANGIDADTYRSSLKGRPAEKCYDWILSQMASHYTIPSFAARNQSKADTYTLKYNPDKQDYSLTLTDTNNTLANLSLSASGIKVSRSGNQYTFTSDKMITSPITVSAQKAVNLDCDEMLIWGCVGKQTMVSGASDPVYFQLFQQLFYLADHKYGGSLPVHCHFIMDEFANVSLPDDFDKILSVMRSRGVSVSIILQNLAQLKALFEKQWESIVGNCDEFLYLGGNEQSTHKYVSELLGKETIDTNTYGKSSGRSGNYSTNYQISGRELMTPDEVRMLDNRYALLFVRGERPVMDFKYDIMKHPNVKLTADGGQPPYNHGEPTQAVATLVFDSDIPQNAVSINAVSTSYELLSDEDLEEIFNL